MNQSGNRMRLLRSTLSNRLPRAGVACVMVSTMLALLVGGTEQVLTADFYGDGRPDILGANHGGPRQPVELWLNQLQQRAAPGPLRVHPANPRYFTDGTTNASGAFRAVYLTGSHTWNSLQDVTGNEWYLPNLLSKEGFEAYLDFLGAHGHNFIRLWIVEHAWNEKSGARIAPHPWPRNGPGKALDGLPRFDLSQFDPVYFKRLRDRVLAARDRGIYVSVMLFGGMWGTEHPATWKGHPFQVANNINGIDGDADGDGLGNEIYTLRLAPVVRVQKATASRVVETLQDLDNVLFEVANEVREYSTAWQYEIIRHVKAVEARLPRQHPVGMTGYNSIPHQALLDSPADWISPSSSGGHYKNDPPPADGRKVILTDTDHLWGEGGNPGWVWKSFTRGLHPIWMDRVRMGHGDLPQADAIRGAMGQTRRLAERLQLATMRPRGELASSGFCLADPVAAYVIYLPQGAEVTVDLSAASGLFVAEWIHPANGPAQTVEAISAGGRRVLQAPFEGDAVLFLRKDRTTNTAPAATAVMVFPAKDGLICSPANVDEIWSGFFSRLAEVVVAVIPSRLTRSASNPPNPTSPASVPDSLTTRMSPLLFPLMPRAFGRPRPPFHWFLKRTLPAFRQK